MKNPTRKEFDQIIRELDLLVYRDKRVTTALIEQMSLPEMCRSLAYKLWIAQVPEDERTKILRSQCLSLITIGQFSFREED